ncbi:MAG: GNAT family N-acetyltransferase [Actinobacteria bacterium]|nr:GNAT family N-acetyltransferase [Actinomycetota bacterium]MCB8998264.1 GNAT family N-acetyltransferase [Actinomycetota bacterium]MCB9415558.1 GNAT family N-acetyltransferase [Actinomycetota bacterium]HRY08936.1 GNAT family N-acetyltransferase [Candidatus Nanopelagicales bacterium]
MRIRRASTDDDAKTVRAIIDEVYVGGGWADPVTSPEYVRSLLDARTRIATATVLLAEHRGRAVGTVTATDGPPWANIARPGELEVRMLGVLPTARRGGVARALMGACEDLARSSGARRIVLSTEREMTAAQALYETLGYTRTPQRDWVINSTTLITYARQLSD